MIKATTFFLEYYMINRTNYIIADLKSNMYYLLLNQWITSISKNNFLSHFGMTGDYFCYRVFFYYNELQVGIMNLRTEVIKNIISKFPGITLKELQERIAILDNYLKRGYI